MFKLESYITPLILSYVDKYVKNVKAERSQVSWLIIPFFISTTEWAFTRRLAIFLRSKLLMGCLNWTKFNPKRCILFHDRMIAKSFVSLKTLRLGKVIRVEGSDTPSPFSCLANYVVVFFNGYDTTILPKVGWALGVIPILCIQFLLIL